MRLEQAVGTSFTVDLATALTVPVSFAGHSLAHDVDPVTLMQALQAAASRLDIFAQAGAILGSRWPSDLAVLLEPVLHEVRRPRPGHLFHPKAWVVRYGDKDGDGARGDVFRALVLSRNLTADRSWDVIVRLDGLAGSRVNHDNDGLARFVSALPQLAKVPLPGERVEPILNLAGQLRRVWWEPPEGASAVRFWPFGLPGMRRPSLADLFTGYRHLVVSPFLTGKGLDAVIRPAAQGSEATVVSRAEELDKLPADALEGLAVHVINPAASLADETGAEAEDPPAAPLGALHAKVIVVEKNHRARAFFGSANATTGATGGNVELLCELEGGPSRLGVGAMLDDPGGFRALLEDYVSPSAPVIDEAGEFGRQLDNYLVDAAQLAYSMAVTPEGDQWRAVITTNRALPAPPEGTTVSLSPFNRLTEHVPLVGGRPVRVELAARDAVEVTPFLALQARGVTRARQVERSTVVKAEIDGGPVDRLEEILARQIDSPEKFLRLLLLLLLGIDDPSIAAVAQPGGLAGPWADAGNTGIFELLVRGLAAQPAAMDRLDDLTRRISARPDADHVLPSGWTDLWPVFAEARKLARDTA
jgi:hypothetical protein